MKQPGGYFFCQTTRMVPLDGDRYAPTASGMLVTMINSSRAILAKPKRADPPLHRYRSTGSPRDLTRPIRVGRTSRITRLLIADGQELIRLGLRAMLADESGLSIRGEAGTLAEMVAETQRVRPDLVLLDAHLSGGSAAEACQLLLKANSRIRILIMTQERNTTVLRKALKAGAHGLVSKDSCQAELLQAIHLVTRGDADLKSAGENRGSTVQRRDGTRTPHSKLSLLSPQERRILPLLVEGKTNHEIGLELTLAKVTVKNYIANMFKKLNIGRRSQAVAVYLQTQVQGMHGSH